MDRYQFTKTGQDRYQTTRYPKFPKQQSDLYIISRDGDRLDVLANEFYADPRYWWVLAEVNNIGKGTMIITSGQQLRIPFPITGLLNRLRDVEENK
jgi:hypothetical protein